MEFSDKGIITGKIGTVKYYLFNAGSFFTDGGSAYGVLPKAVWSKTSRCDDKNRIELACNLLVLQSEGNNILIDSGIGGIIDEKTEKIYKPESSKLIDYLSLINLKREDIDKVVLTHLHHDHIGGLVTGTEEKPELTFPDAEYVIQKPEWDTALNPDELNSGAYRYRLPLELLESQGRIKFIEGDYDLTKDINLIFAGGHSVGSQIVRVFSSGELLYYAGDIIPQQFHLNPAVTSAYDLSRQQTITIKKRVLDELNSKGGTLVLNHQTGQMTRYFPPLREQG